YKHVDELRNDLSQVRETKALKATAKVRKKASFTRHRLYFGFAILLILLTVSGLAYFLNRSKPIDSIAVLPFVNSNNDPDIEYLGDGITETLITKLSLLPQLRVMARSTVFRFKGKDVTPQQVGEQLNVRAVLMGEIVQRDDVLRLNAELVDVSDGAQIWGDQYNRTLDDIFAVQDAISEQISTGLRLKLSRKEKSRLDKQYTEDPEAYQLYLKGRFHWNKRTVQDLNTALDYFQQAVNRDPTYALAYAGMADCYVLLPLNAYSGLSGKEAYPKAKAAALQALQIDEQLAEAHTALAMTYLYFDKDTVSAKKSFLLAIELNSNYATGHHWYAIEYLSRPGHHDKAIAEMKRALTLDPLSLVINGDLGWAYWRAGYYDLALEQFQNTIRMDQNFYLAYWGLGWTHIAMGEIAKAIEPLQQASQLSDTPKIVASLGYAYGITGGTEGAKKTLVQLDELSSRREVTPIEFAMIYAGLGDKDKAIEFLQRGLKQVDIDQQQAWLPHWDDYNLFWDNLRDDARFVELLKKVGLEK
ncbi:MAG: hypothetical protein ACE5IR_25650, partial [bacterium]